MKHFAVTKELCKWSQAHHIVASSAILKQYKKISDGLKVTIIKTDLCQMVCKSFVSDLKT